MVDGTVAMLCQRCRELEDELCAAKKNLELMRMVAQRLQEKVDRLQEKLRGDTRAGTR